MRKIVAIGGGEIFSEDGVRETLKIDKEILKLSDKENPNILFIPTASRDSISYCSNFNKYFGNELGCKVDFLLLYSNDNEISADRKISKADIIYVGGGNTLKMMKKWRYMGVDKMLVNAADNGTIMTGMSAGGICWFRYGASDSRRFSNPNADMIKVSGLGLINSIVCPHYSANPHRKDYLKILMSKTSGVSVALDDCAAIEIIGDDYRIINSDNTANAFKIYWSRGKYHKQVIEIKSDFTPLSDLLIK